MLVRMEDGRLAWRNEVPHTHDGGPASPEIPTSSLSPSGFRAMADDTPSVSDSTSAPIPLTSCEDGENKPTVAAGAAPAVAVKVEAGAPAGSVLKEPTAPSGVFEEKPTWPAVSVKQEPVWSPVYAEEVPAWPPVAAKEETAWQPRHRPSGAGATKAGKSALDGDAPVKAAVLATEPINCAVVSGTDKVGCGGREWRGMSEVLAAAGAPVEPKVGHAVFVPAERAIVRISGLAQAPLWSITGRVPDSTSSGDR